LYLSYRKITLLHRRLYFELNNTISPRLPLLIFSVNRIYNYVPNAQHVTLTQVNQKKLYFGQRQYITKMYSVNDTCLLK